MKYEEFTNAVRKCDFIKDADTAAAAIRAVLGIVASSLQEEDARKLTASLPEPLFFQRLRGHKEVRLNISLPQFVSEIGQDFQLNDLQAGLLILTVLHKAEKSVEDTRLKTCLNRFSNEIDNILNPTPSG
jgi:uncharacterized protein (DUF2267 family)